MTARFVWRPKIPSAGMPSACCTATTAGPFEPFFSIPVETAVVAVCCWAVAVCTDGVRIAVAASAKPTFRAVGTFARRAASLCRRSLERFSDRSHSSQDPRSRRPGGSAKIAQPSSCTAPLTLISNPSSLLLAPTR